MRGSYAIVSSSGRLRRGGFWKQVTSQIFPYLLVPVRHSVGLPGKTVSAEFSEELVRYHSAGSAAISVSAIDANAMMKELAVASSHEWLEKYCA